MNVGINPSKGRDHQAPSGQGHEVIAPPQGQGTCRRWQGEWYGVPSSPQRILCRGLTNFDKKLFLYFHFNHGFRMFCFGNVTKIFLLLLCYVLRIRLWAYVGDLRDFFGFSYRQRKKKISHHPYSTTTTMSQATVLRRLSQSNSYRRHCPNNLSTAVLQITSSPSIETSSFFFPSV